jgi:hypothetical protein
VEYEIVSIIVICDYLKTRLVKPLVNIRRDLDDIDGLPCEVLETDILGFWPVFAKV